MEAMAQESTQKKGYGFDLKEKLMVECDRGMLPTYQANQIETSCQEDFYARNSWQRIRMEMKSN